MHCLHCKGPLPRLTEILCQRHWRLVPKPLRVALRAAWHERNHAARNNRKELRAKIEAHKAILIRILDLVATKDPLPSPSESRTPA